MDEKLLRKILREELADLTIPELLTPKDVSSILKVRVGTLSNWRGKGMGPEYKKITSDGSVRYEKKAIIQYLKKSN